MKYLLEFAQFADTTTSDVKVTREQYNKNFWKWFGKSKVVNPDGTPMIVYHGTENNFNIFQNGDIGFHFGTRKAAVSRLRTKKVYGERRIFKELYLKIENPLEMIDVGGWYASGVLRELVKMGLYEEIEMKKLNELWNELCIKHGYNKTSNWNSNAANNEMKEYVKSLIIAKGFDGIKYINNIENRGSISWIVFDATQVKSATDNNGNFDPLNPDING